MWSMGITISSNILWPFNFAWQLELTRVLNTNDAVSIKCCNLTRNVFNTSSVRGLLNSFNFSAFQDCQNTVNLLTITFTFDRCSCQIWIWYICFRMYFYKIGHIPNGPNGETNERSFRNAHLWSIHWPVSWLLLSLSLPLLFCMGTHVASLYIIKMHTTPRWIDHYVYVNGFFTCIMHCSAWQILRH